jgi:hypothetical protein
VFHQNRIKHIQTLSLKKILKRKNPYLFRGKNILTAQDLIKPILDAYLSSQEETIFGDFLEELAIFVCGEVFGGFKSAAEGIDLEFTRKNIRYLVSIKSGPNWGNSSQIQRMKSNFKQAQKILGSSIKEAQVTFVNGCCYGQDGKPNKGDYWKICGQAFWELISGNERLYIEIIEPLGHKAKEKNDAFYIEYTRILNCFTLEFGKEFCDNGIINWKKLVEYNSKNKR